MVYWEDPNQQYIYSERYNDLLKETLRGVNTDWKAQPLRNAVGHKHVVYLEGGDEAFQYGIDFSFNNVVGVMKGSGRKTFSGGLTFSYRYKNLLLRDQLEVVYNRGDNSPWGDFSEYTSMNPYFRPYDENGNLIKTYTLYEGSTEINPMWNAMIKTKDMTEYSQFTNNFYAEWRAFEGFKASARIGLTRTDNGAEIFLPATHTDFATYTTDELLNRRLHRATTSLPYEDWLVSHQPFHWLAEFYQIIHDNGGFDVIIGNPPYVSISGIKYDLSNYQTVACGDLYAICIERIKKNLTCNHTRMGLIVPISIVSTDGYEILRNIIVKGNTGFHFSKGLTFSNF